MKDVLLQVGDWLVPSLVGAVIYYLRSISTSIQGLSKALAVANERSDGHERRIERCEDALSKRP